MVKKIIYLQIIITMSVIGFYYVYTNQGTQVGNGNPVRDEFYFVKNIEKKYAEDKVSESFYKIFKTKDNYREPKLVFRFSKIHCGSCVTREIRLLRDYAKKINWENIIFIATNNDQEYLDRFKRVARIQTEIYNVEREFTPIDREKIKTPYMFILDSDSTFKNLFISMKLNEERTEHYLEKITDIYFN